MYYPTLKAHQSHSKICPGTPSTWEDEEDSSDEELNLDNGDPADSDSAPTEDPTSSNNAPRTPENIFDRLNRKYGYDS